MKHASETRPAPRLFDDRAVAELLVPIRADRLYERAVFFAARLAAAWDLPVRLLHVHTPDEVAGDSDLDAATTRLVARYPRLDIRSSSTSDVDVASGIRSAAAEDSMVIVATDRVSQATDVQSVGVDMVEASDGLLMLCGPQCDTTELDQSVVVALDGSLYAEAAVEVGVALAQSADAKLWLLNVVDETTAAQVAKLKASGTRVSESGYLREISDELTARGINNGWEIVHNADPAAGIVRFTESRGASFIVASSHGHSDLGGRAFGSVCLGIIEHSSRPVIVVKR